MDHGTGHGSTPSPTSSSDMPGMPGMDSGSGDEHGQSPDHASAGEVAPPRPLAPVLGTFGGGTAAVMLTAGFLRRRDRARDQAKKAARAARRART